MTRPFIVRLALGLTVGVAAFAGAAGAEAADSAAKGFVPLMPKDSLEGWRFSDWSDVAVPQKLEGTPWKIADGVLEGLGKRTWIFSEREYGDFVLKFEGKLSEGANSGIGLRFPPKGDPAYQGMEIQFVDEAYYQSGNWDGARPEQLTGSIYDEIAAKPAVKPAGQWNSFELTCRGSRVTVVLNGKKVLDVDLSKEIKARQQKGPPLAERPKKGRIGFQNLNGQVSLRNIMIKTLD